MSGSNQDLDHDFGGDLALGPTGDLATVTGTVLGQQRVLRRLLTNAGDYIWHLAYGAGLPAVIGTPVDAVTIEGMVRGQIFLEAAVARLAQHHLCGCGRGVHPDARRFARSMRAACNFR
jgi:hypothetical protein